MALYGYKVGAGVREKRKTQELQQNFGALMAPHLEHIAALEDRIAALEDAATAAPETTKRGPGRPPKDKE